MNKRKGENDCKKYSMIKSPWKNVADPAGIESATSWSPVECKSNRATEAGLGNDDKLKQNNKNFVYSQTSIA